jgi:uncharacterized protein (DUF58 family)
MLTTTGRGLATITVLLLAAGWYLGYAELLVLGAAGLLALVLAALWMFARPDVTVQREIRPVRVIQAQECHGVLTVTNHAGRRSPPITAVEQVGSRAVVVPVPSLPAHGNAVLGYRLPTDRRGVFAVGPLTVGHSDPLRLMRLARAFPSQAVLTVHPRWHPVGALPTGRAQDLDGPTTDTAPHGGVAFHSLREYVAGDDRRLIHWRSSARTGTLMVRHLVVPNEPRMLVVLDTSARPYADGVFEEAVRVAASLAVAAVSQGFPLQLRTTGGTVVSVEAGAPDLRPPLDLLAAVRLDPDDPGLAALAGIVPEDGGVSLGVVTGQHDDGAVRVISAVRSRYAMASLIQVGERFGRPAPGLRGVFSLNVATSEDFARGWQSVLTR